MAIRSSYDGMTAGTGLGGHLFEDRRKFYIDEGSYSELWPSITPFTTAIYTRAQRKRGLADPVFKMFEGREAWEKEEVVINNGAGYELTDANTSVSCAVDGIVGLPTAVAAETRAWFGLQFEIWDAAKQVRRGNALCVGAGAGVLYLTHHGRTDGTAASIMIADNDVLVCVGHNGPENDTAPGSYGDDLRTVWGSTQITRTAVEITGTLHQMVLRGASNELERYRRAKLRTHKMRIEKMFLRAANVQGSNLNGGETFSDLSRAADSNSPTGTSGKKIRGTMGFIPAILRYGVSTETATNQNIFYRQQNLGYNQFIDDTEKMWQYLPDDGIKDFFCGPRALSYWSKMAVGTQATSTGFPIKISDMRQDTLGMFFKYLETPFGIARLIYTPALKREYSNYMLAPSFEHLYHATFRDFAYYTNIKTDDNYDGVKDEYFSDEGVGMSMIENQILYVTPLTA